jgi:hypothetical protein
MVKQSQKRPLNACVMFLTVRKKVAIVVVKVYTYSAEPCNYSLNKVQGL